MFTPAKMWIITWTNFTRRSTTTLNVPPNVQMHDMPFIHKLNPVIFSKLLWYNWNNTHRLCHYMKIRHFGKVMALRFGLCCITPLWHGLYGNVLFLSIEDLHSLLSNSAQIVLGSSSTMCRLIIFTGRWNRTSFTEWFHTYKFHNLHFTIHFLTSCTLSEHILYIRQVLVSLMPVHLEYLAINWFCQTF